MSKEFLIAANEKEFLEKPKEWFDENRERIRRACEESIFWKRRFIFLSEGQKFPLDVLVRRLLELNYQRVDYVDRLGTFRQKGGFFEIFSPGLERPLRIGLSGNVIQEIQPFEVKIQKRIAPVETIFKFGDYVIHKDHGIGIFRGTLIEKNRIYFEIEYAPAREGGPRDRLLVPEEKKGKLSLYLGFTTPTLHRLSSPLWLHTKKKVKESVEKFAKELLELYKKRVVARRPVTHGDPQLENELAETFEYELTEGQEKALEDIYADFEKEEPMERLVCADVGFGKTEVALRVAVRVVASHGQVAFISPTTILAFQHYQTFRKRLENFPIIIEFLSRIQPFLYSTNLRSLNGRIKKKRTDMIEGIKSGKVDIVIGTHRLLQKDIAFKNLRLLIIDEEQKFGVRQKELLKNLDPSLDVLYLSATPIPRTLYMALSHVKKISLIETPPPERQSIETFISPYSTKIIKESIEKELNRGGQIFFLHNRIDSIENVKHSLEKLFPHISIEVLHGRLNEREMIERLISFQQGKIKILVATTIIENGLDLHNVNTLIVDESSLLGLAEAHQLRGRIGRGERKAHSYFLYQKKKLTEEAERRLEALERFQELGSGYQIALKDLEIRGAGNVLGKEQSGNINLVGMNLYLEILNSALEA